MLTRVTSGVVRLRDLMPGQHSSEVMSQLWRHRVRSDRPRIEPQTSLTVSGILNRCQPADF